MTLYCHRGEYHHYLYFIELLRAFTYYLVKRKHPNMYGRRGSEGRVLCPVAGPRPEARGAGARANMWRGRGREL